MSRSDDQCCRLRSTLTTCIAHPAYHLKSRLGAAHPGFNLVEVLMENLNRLWRGDAALRNQFV